MRTALQRNGLGGDYAAVVGRHAAQRDRVERLVREDEDPQRMRLRGVEQDVRRSPLEQREVADVEEPRLRRVGGRRLRDCLALTTCRGYERQDAERDCDEDDDEDSAPGASHPFARPTRILQCA